MKQYLPKSLLSLYFIVLSYFAYSQNGGVSINNSNAPAHPSAILDVSSTSAPYMGMLIPRMTTANRNSISSPAVGLQVFNIDCGVTEYYTGTCWISTSQNLKSPDQITCSGTTDFCANESRTFTISAITGATNYVWTVPAGATVISGQGTTSATVAFGNHSGDVCVHASNICESSGTTCMNVYVNAIPPTPGNITGPTTVVPNTSVSYFIAAVTGTGVYNWTVPAGATITSGVGTTTVTVNFSCSAVSGNITVAAQSNCGTSVATALAINVTSVLANAGPAISSSPGTLGGSPTASGGTSPYTYTWVPSTALSATTVPNPTTTVCAVTVYAVTVTDAKGCTAISSTTASMFNPVSANAGPDITSPGTLGGSPTASGGTSQYTYSWLPSTGLSSTTVANPIASIVCTSVTYTVTVTDANGCTAQSSTTASNASPPLAPGTISGNSSFCANASGMVYSISTVANANSYNWTVPAGASITSNIGTSITVTFGTSAGNITVSATNACGTSSVSSITLSTASSTGGTITQVGGFTIHTFTASGTFTPSPCLSTVQVLVVAGGGGGGGGSPGNGGGGGAGGYIYNAAYAITAGSYFVTVGAGGAGGNDNIGSNGENSVFGTITSTGGGGGGSYGHGSGQDGGSGGGTPQEYGSGGYPGSGMVGQGNNGGSRTSIGYGGGGGGGAGAVGGNDSGVNGKEGGPGGIGITSSISGTSATYSGGGGGSTHNSGSGVALGGAGGGGNGHFLSTLATVGATNTGGGGGGGGESIMGANGGSGIVIIRYPN